MAIDKDFCFLELDVHTTKGKCKAFLQPGFFPRTSATNRYHKHGYAEVHVGLSGESVFSSDGEHYVLKKGQLLILPPHRYHCCTHRSEEAKTSSFLAVMEVTEPCYHSLSPALLDAYREELNLIVTDQNFARLPYYIGLLLTVATGCVLSAPDVNHYGVLIHDFFNVHYSEDIHIKDLAEHLHLSVRQTERLVKEHTAHSFRQELFHARLSAAKHLLETTGLSPKEVCIQTGFKSVAELQKTLTVS
ncbi:MAG: helix-turn-helix domain-containing protein [Clostridia bacterium]|nr:helix-turn-helix domain-containing protein [Clostridia bacterium]